MSEKYTKKKIRPLVFYPAFILLVLTIILNFVDQEAFIRVTSQARDFMTQDIGWLFSLMGVACLIIVIIAFFTPLGDIRLGGEQAAPILKKNTWFAVTLTTTIASGIMFWGTAEPISHLAYPPEGVEPMSADAVKFAMEALFLHWTFLPYAFYTVPALVFGFAYYNMNRPFSVGSEVSPIMGNRDQRKFDVAVDAVILFTLATGIASSFATAVMNMGSGMNALTGLPDNVTMYIVIAVLATIIFTAASGTGLFRGIKYLAHFNVYLYYVIIAAFVVLGPTVYMFSLGTEGFGGFLSGIFDRALFTGTAAGDDWASDWTTFYWTNWMAWAPVTAVFLARIAYGYKIKEMITMNFFIPAGFSTVWMTIVGGTSINFQMSGRLDLVSIMDEAGEGAVAYAILNELPFGFLLIAIYLIAVFITFATATDSTTNAMSGISTTGIESAEDEAPLSIKTLWGVIIGCLAVISLSVFGTDGIRILSYLGGIPALIIGFLSFLSLIFLIKNPEKFNKRS
ncbi:BCCT family transporter [Salibacterium aidingense]|uniref:BCCT family transporter n=1 Tax=Salibacterium aidingense TaxID=384933 RepID=UPI003BDA9732